MAFAGTGKIWMNGSLVDWKDATIHVASHALHYGTGVFEGIRAYDSKAGTNVFRLEPHMRRLMDSCRVYRMEPRWSQAELSQAVLDTVRVNGFKSCYIRPLVYRGYDSLTLDPRPCPVDASVVVWEWSLMMGADALEQGIDVGVSSWTRLAPNTLPALAKGTANYANSALIKMQAVLDGYADAVALDESGLLSEGSGQNLFLVRDGIIYTPSLGSSVLQGITRETVITLASDLGYTVRETSIPREFLYLADEAFFCGTAVEITPIRTIDKITVGSGKRGPVTAALQQRFFGILRGELPDTHDWLTPVSTETAAARPEKAAAAAR
ncbi:MAG: branched-chain amino acid transaminase [Vicinamibacterales bacterium]